MYCLLFPKEKMSRYKIQNTFLHVPLNESVEICEITTDNQLDLLSPAEQRDSYDLFMLTGGLEILKMKHSFLGGC